MSNVKENSNKSKKRRKDDADSKEQKSSKKQKVQSNESTLQHSSTLDPSSQDSQPKMISTTPIPLPPSKWKQSSALEKSTKSKGKRKTIEEDDNGQDGSKLRVGEEGKGTDKIKTKEEKHRNKRNGKREKRGQSKAKEIESSNETEDVGSLTPLKEVQGITDPILENRDLATRVKKSTLRKPQEKQASSGTVSSGRLKIPADTLSTGLHLITANMYLPVYPIAIKYSLEGAIAEAISPLLLTYHAPFKGYVLAHRNARATEGNGSASRCIDQYGMSFLWVTVDVLVFRPVKGAWLKGMVGLQSESHISLIVWNYFSARVEKKRLPVDWRFVEEEYEAPLDETETHVKRSKVRRSTGAYHDGKGRRIEGALAFRAVDFEVTRSGDGQRTLMTIEGSLVDEVPTAE
jgi:DNA-directed RNA polymerase I subunit RPA43